MLKTKIMLGSNLFSIALIIVLVWQWQQLYMKTENSIQFVNEQDVMEMLKPYLESYNGERNDFKFVKTGIYIQSMEFSKSSEVLISGYVWLKFKDGVHDDIDSEFRFPDVTSSAMESVRVEAYRFRAASNEVIGWYFEAKLRQNLDYMKYPFDSHTIRIKITPRDFNSLVILVPDYSSYYSTGLNDMFGIKSSVMLDSWELNNTYFNYWATSYDTNFGIPDLIGSVRIPDLTFNIDIRRYFISALIIHLLPVLFVVTLLYGVLITIDGSQERMSRHGFNVATIIGMCISLIALFVAMHVQLRQEFAAYGFVYLEYYYLLVYILLIVVSVNAFMYSMEWSKYFHQRNNLFIKVGYWPLVLSFIVTITFMVM